MLTTTIGALLPSALAVALSPIPLVAVILMLATPRAKVNGPAFAVGWVAGLVAVTAIVLVASSGASDAGSTSDTGVNWFQTGIGVLFLVMAARQWRKRPEPGVEPEMPKWMAGVDAFTPVRALVLGVALSAANPKNLALTASAAASIAQAGLSDGDTVTAAAVFVLIGSASVLGLVLFELVAPKAAAGPLASIKEFMTSHNAVIMMVILLLLGAKLLGQGLGALGA